MTTETIITRKQDTRLGDHITTVRTYGKDEDGATVCLREEITIEGPPEFRFGSPQDKKSGNYFL
jgi:hypothetical protein